MVDRLSGFNGQGTMEKRCGQGQHEPSEPSLESGWEIDK